MNDKRLPVGCKSEPETVAHDSIDEDYEDDFRGRRLK